MLANHKIKISRKKQKKLVLLVTIKFISSKTKVNYKTFLSQSLKVIINGPTVSKQQMIFEISIIHLKHQF